MTTFIERRALLICIVFVMVTFTSNAQISGSSSGLLSSKTSQMSDQQIMQIWQQAQKSGMSESDAMSLLVKRGLPSSEVNSFKKRLLQLQNGSKSKSGVSKINIKDTAYFLKDSSWVNDVPQIRKNSRYFGFDFFSNPDITFEPNIRITTPKNYIHYVYELARYFMKSPDKLEPGDVKKFRMYCFMNGSYRRQASIKASAR